MVTYIAHLINGAPNEGFGGTSPFVQIAGLPNHVLRCRQKDSQAKPASSKMPPDQVPLFRVGVAGLAIARAQ
jgi:hypothetical protein